MSIKLCHRIQKNHASSRLISIAHRSPWVKEASAVHVESLEKSRVRNCAEVIVLQITTQPCEG